MTKSAVAFLAIGLAAFATIWLSSPWGTGTTPDSMQYLDNARSWLSGESFLAWERHWPPMYSLVIGLLAHLVGDVLDAARLLQALVFGLNASLIGWITYRLEGCSVLFAAVSAIFFVLLPDAYQVHFLTLSEGLFISFVLLHLSFMRSYQLDGKVRDLALAGVCLGLCVLTRYAGLALLAASGVYVLYAGGRGWRRGLVCAAQLLVPALLLPVAWLIAASLYAPATASRVLSVHLVDGQRLIDLLVVLTAWFTFSWFEPATFVIAALSVASVVWALFKAPLRERNFIALLGFMFVTYIVFLLVSISFFDYYTPLDQRILLPAFVLYWLAVTASVKIVAGNRPSGEYVACALMLLIAVSRLPAYNREVSQNIREGRGYYSRSARLLPVFDYLKNSGFVSVYANAPKLLSAHVNVKARLLPRFFDPASNQRHPDYVANMDAMMRDVEANGAVIVYVHSFRWRTYLPGPGVFDALRSLERVYAGPDALIYRARAASASPEPDKDR